MSTLPPGAGVVAPQFADLADAVNTDALTQNRSERAQLQSAYLKSVEAETAARKKADAAVKPMYEPAQKALAAPLPEPPAAPDIPPAPSRKLTDFLAPVAGESPENTITKLIQGIGLMASGIVGLKRGDATAALAGLHGALKGWQEGDKERADRAFSDWSAASKRVADDWERRHRLYRDALENNDLTIQQRVEAVKLKALEEGHDVAAAQATRNDIGELLQWNREDGLALEKFNMDRARLAEQHFWKEMHLEQQRAMMVEGAKYHQALLADRAQARKDALDNKMAAAEAKRDEKNSQKAHGSYYDFANGEVREISLGQWQENNERINRGERPAFRPLSNQQIQLVERLAVAPPILDRLDELINKINAEAPGENITTGLINKLKGKAGISADIQEINTLNLDNALENAAALSGGQPRIAILQMIRGEATPNVSMTADVAHRLVQTTRTTIANRLAKTTGDPDAFDKTSKGLTRYGQKPPQKFDFGNIKIERLPD